MDEAELFGDTGEEGFKEAFAIHAGRVEAEPLFSPDEKRRPHNLDPSELSSELVFRAIEPGSSFSLAGLAATFMRRNGEWVYKELILSLGEAASPRAFVGLEDQLEGGLNLSGTCGSVILTDLCRGETEQRGSKGDRTA